jgi:hypothetical protein
LWCPSELLRKDGKEKKTGFRQPDKTKITSPLPGVVILTKLHHEVVAFNKM